MVDLRGITVGPLHYIGGQKLAVSPIFWGFTALVRLVTMKPVRRI